MGIIVADLSVVWKTEFSLVVPGRIPRILGQNPEALGIKTRIDVQSFQCFIKLNCPVFIYSNFFVIKFQFV